MNTESELPPSIQGCMGYITLKARQYAAAFNVPTEDLVQEGCLAVMAAEQSFDPAYARSFFSYAARPIRWRMLRYAMRTANDIRVTEQKFDLLRFDTIRLEDPAGSDTEEGTFADIVGLPENITPLLDLQDRAALLTAALARLKPRAREMIRRHFLEGQSLTDIAADFGISRQAVCEMCKRSLRKLRRSAILKEAA